MKKILLIFIFISLISFKPKVKSSTKTIYKIEKLQKNRRIQELNKYWNNLVETVVKGDFEGYRKAYHKDAVIVLTAGKNKVSLPAEKVLSRWKQGFIDTKDGKNISNVEFRFSQRLGDTTTAHETGIFQYTTSKSDGSKNVEYLAHFEMLLVKKNNKWLAVMEYQKSKATLKEWNALKK